MTKTPDNNRLPPPDEDIPDWYDWRTLPIDEIMHERMIYENQ